MANVTVVEETPPASEPDVVQAEQIAAVAEAVVEVATIEAERDIAIAEIHAETEEQSIASREHVDGVLNGDNEWRQSIETRLAAQETSQTKMLSILRELREPPPNQSENSENPEAMRESQEAPEPAPVKKRPHHSLI